MNDASTEHSPMGYGDVDARPDNGDPTNPATFEDSSHQDMAAAKPPHGADDGKSGGEAAGSRGAPNFSQGSHGTNVLNDQPKGSESEKTAPGISSDKHSDDTK